MGLSIFALNFMINRIFIVMSDAGVIDYENTFIEKAMYIESWIIFISLLAVSVPTFLAGINLKKQQGLLSGWWFANFVPMYLLSSFPMNAIFMLVDYDLSFMLFAPVINTIIFIFFIGLGFFMMNQPMNREETKGHDNKKLSKEANLVRILSIVNFSGLAIALLVSFINSSTEEPISFANGVNFVIEILFYISIVFTHFFGAYLMGARKGKSWWWVVNFVLTVVIFVTTPFALFPMLMPDIWVYIAILFFVVIPPVAVILISGLTLVAFNIGKKTRKVELIPHARPNMTPVDETEFPSTNLTKE